MARRTSSHQPKQLLLLGIFLALLGGMGTSVMTREARSDGQLPIRSIVVKIEPGRQDQFFDQLRGFADKHEFAIRIAQTNPARGGFGIDMWRGDFWISGFNPFDADIFRVRIYENERGILEKIPMPYVEALMEDLSTFIDDVPNTVFLER